MKTILVPVDLVVNLTAMLDYTVSIARTMNARIKFYYVVFDPTLEVPLYTFDANALQEEVLANLKKEAESKGKKLIENLRARYPDVSCEFLTSRGKPQQTILHAIEKEQPDLVVMGSEYPTGIKKLLVGSIALGVVNDAGLPVMVIPENDLQPIKHILYATNFAGDDNRNLEHLLNWFERGGISIHVIHFAMKEDADSQGDLEALKAHFRHRENEQVMSFEILPANDLIEAMKEYVAENSIDLISTTTHHRNIISRLFDPSQTAKIISILQQPVLAFQQ